MPWASLIPVVGLKCISAGVVGDGHATSDIGIETGLVGNVLGHRRNLKGPTAGI